MPRTLRASLGDYCYHVLNRRVPLDVLDQCFDSTLVHWSSTTSGTQLATSATRR